ncbi:MAG: hypothetical protein ACUVT2_12630 [Thiobacillaceae bacterium]
MEFTPDLLNDLSLTVMGLPVWGGVFMQAYEPTTGVPQGWYEDGRVAAVENRYGKGRTLLLGTMLGYGHGLHAGNNPYPSSAPFFAKVLGWAGVEQHVRCSEPRVKARLHDGPGGVYLWVANPTRQARPVRLELGQAWGPYTAARTLWGAQAQVQFRLVELTIPGRDVTVLELNDPVRALLP